MYGNFKQLARIYLALVRMVSKNVGLEVRLSIYFKLLIIIKTHKYYKISILKGYYIK